MKKLLNISVIAALAVLPMAANADPTTGTTGDNAPITTNNAPTYKGAASGDNDGSLATAGYVKGAYNDAIKAVNKVHTTAQAGINAINDLIGDTTELEEGETLMDAISAAQEAATTAAGAYDNTDSGLQATTVQDAIDELADEKIDESSIATSLTGSSTDAQVASAKAVYDGLALKQNASDSTVANGTYNYITQGTGVGTNLQALDTAVDANADAIAILNGNASQEGSVAKAVADAMATVEGDFATQDGVVATIGDATVTTAAATGTVSVLATWGNDTATTANVTIPALSGTVSVDDYNDGQS